MNVIYDIESGRVLITEMDGVWTLPCEYELAHFEAGFEPVFIDVDGDLYLKPNTSIINGADLK